MVEKPAKEVCISFLAGVMGKTFETIG